MRWTIIFEMQGQPYQQSVTVDLPTLGMIRQQNGFFVRRAPASPDLAPYQKHEFFYTDLATEASHWIPYGRVVLAYKKEE